MIENLTVFFTCTGFLFSAACFGVGAGMILRGAFAAVLFAWQRRAEQDEFVREEALKSGAWRRQV